MITITEPKIAGFVPRWAPFAGFSLLFDNPGASLRQEGRVEVVACDVENDPALEFYRRLRQGFVRLEPDRLLQAYLLCPLPPTSYHVTVFDVANEGDFRHCRPDAVDGLRRLLSGVPERDWPLDAPILQAALESPLSTGTWDLRFGYGELRMFGRGGVALHLRPLDPEKFEAFVEVRRGLSIVGREGFGTGAGERYSPHVSLGYFANPQAAESAVGRIVAWDAVLRESVGEAALEFATASLYAFSDMATFFRSGAKTSGATV